MGDIDVTRQPRRVDWNVPVWTMMTHSTVLVSGGGRHYWMSTCTVWLSHSKWASRAMNLHQILCQFEHSSAETIQMMQKATAMGSWWLAASSWECTCSCITSCAEFFGKISNHKGTQPLYSPDLVPCDFWCFPKLNSPLKGKRFHTINEIQESMTGQLMVTGRAVWGPEVPTLKGAEASLSCVQCFLYLVSSSINVSIFHITRLDIFCTELLYITFAYK